MAFVAPFFTGLAAAGASSAGIASSMAAAGSLIGTGTAAGIGAGAGMALGSLGGIGSAIAGIGTLAQAGAAQAQGKAEAAAAEFNARSAEQEAASRENLIRQESARRMGMIRSQIGKSGATSAGTPLLVLAESAANAEIDALNAQYTGQRQAALYRAGGANAKAQGRVMAGASLLSGMGKIF